MWYNWKKDEKVDLFIKATMPGLPKEIVDITKVYLNKEIKPQTTPGTQGMTLDNDKNSGKVMPIKYQLVVRKINYLTGKIMPEGSNASCKLS